MSDEEAGYWLKLTEKIVGVVLYALGNLMFYFTAISIDNLGAFSWLFTVLGVALLVIGLFIITENIVGLILIIVSNVMIYVTAISVNSLGVYSWLFVALGIVMLIIGLFIVIVKSPE